MSNPVKQYLWRKKIHRGLFAVMDGTFAGEGPGPGCMTPHVKNVILASADQVAIDAVAAKMMGFDPLRDCKYIRLAHDRGLGCGDVGKIQIVGDVSATSENWHFVGPFKNMTFASKMQHKIYWGGLKAPIEWSLKTWLAPWSYVASVLYHDFYWYPFKSKPAMKACLDSDWGRLFHNWENAPRTPSGFADTGPANAPWSGHSVDAVKRAVKILATCLVEAPEYRMRRRRRA